MDDLTRPLSRLKAGFAHISPLISSTAQRIQHLNGTQDQIVRNRHASDIPQNVFSPFWYGLLSMGRPE